jgi:precorrin-4/cobalt-precorrin-4 C11-methyltransferase
MKIYFIGAGPGDPELITIKGMRIIQTAQVIMYAGSLVNPEILKWKKKEACVLDSGTMNREEIFHVFEKHKSRKGIIARLHTGDPAHNYYNRKGY